MRQIMLALLLTCSWGVARAAEWQKPYSAPCTERENVFEFTRKPVVKLVGKDKYEISFAVKGYCDVTVAVVDDKGFVLRHVGSGVLGTNAPAPFQKNSLEQTVIWHGKDDLGAYVKEPGKCRVRVMLGVEPELDKWIGATDPHNLPGRNLGLVVDATGAYIMTMGTRTKLYIRKFDRDGNYLQSIVPPSSTIPESRLAGMGYVEYEQGKRALHGTSVYQTTADHCVYPAGGLGKYMGDVQPAVAGNRLFFCNDGKHAATRVFYIHTDGSTDGVGVGGWPLTPRYTHNQARFAASPDGKWIYATADGNPVVWRFAAGGSEAAKAFIGDPKKPGKDDAHFNKALGIACDAKGRICVCDNSNGRLQVFSSEGTLEKTIKIERPLCVCVHQKTGAIYVLHATRVKGKSVYRTVKLASLEKPEETARIDGPFGIMALDSWSAAPRLWFGGGFGFKRSSGVATEGSMAVTVWEESGKTFKKILDFPELAKRAEGEMFSGKPSGSALGAKVVCNPTREHVYYMGKVFDLKTGSALGGYHFRKADGRSMGRISYDDIAFDKKGYMHVHFNPGFYTPGVGRVDATNAKVQGVHTRGSIATYPEIPYDYGVAIKDWEGALPARCQPGSKWFQDGIGVNMRGDVAVQSYIYYVPKMDDVMTSVMADGRKPDVGCDSRVGKVRGGYAGLLRSVRQRQKQGEEVYFIKRRPGIPLAGGTVWIFDSTGELRQACAVNAGDLINGTQIDEDGAIYFVNARPRLFDGKPFLGGQGGTIGKPEAKGNRYPFTGTLIKSTPGALCRVLLEKAPVPMDPLPTRPADLLNINWPGPGGPKAWAEGAAWLYAGASPIVSVGCSCPAQRVHVDWYKRVFVPEQYRHSIGVLDTAGNLVMHLGRFGNQDDALAMKPGAEDIPMSVVRFISGTDNYLCFEDNGERMIVLKLEYHAEETVEINLQ